MVQEQTWFGREPWKSFGIQLLPLTPIAELRDTQSWVEEMLPQFEGSCMSDPTCEEQGWSVLVFASYATIGKWEMAWKGVSALKDDVFETAGGNGHSRTNTLWYIATRPDYYPTATNPNTTTTIDNTNTIPATPTASPSSTRYPTKYDYKKWMPTQPPSPTTL